MNLAKKYYIDENGNMIGYTRYHKSDKTEVVANPFHPKQQKSLLNLQRQLKKRAEGTRCRIKSKKEVERFNEESVQKL